MPRRARDEPVKVGDGGRSAANTRCRDRSRVRPRDAGRLRAGRPHRPGGGEAVTNVVGLILALLFAAFLVIALLFPERF
jgi:hypothetical protein